MSKKDKEVQNIIERLEDLQVKQSGLLSRLERLSTSGDYARAQQPPTVATREFVIGDRVRISNPRLLQADRGRIIKIGKDRITVQAKNGTKVVRKAKNLILENE
jgi:hypothetical protein